MAFTLYVGIKCLYFIAGIVITICIARALYCYVQDDESEHIKNVDSE